MEPQFKSTILRDIARAFAKRQKTLSNKGSFSLISYTDDGFEWMEVVLVTYVKFTLILQLTEDSRGSIYLRSNSRSDRGKILDKWTNVPICGKAESIVKSFEKTLSEYSYGRGFKSDKNLRHYWESVALKLTE